MRARWLVGLGFGLIACGGTAKAPSAAPAPSAVVVAPPASTPTPPGEPALPLDRRVHLGKLANGLTYYVLPHAEPRKRVELWLVVNAGSVLEDDDQRGLAHFVEHMAFNGTRRFPKRELTNLLERSGVRFGADLNATTSFDETIYKLRVPTDKPGLVTESIRVLRDFADGVSFEPAAIEAERGVVMEEWRLGRGADQRVFEKQAPTVLRGSRYAERLPIGLPEIVKSASRDTLLRFYKDWYRPELMAVVAVGDVEPAALIAEITQEFATLAAPATPRQRPRYPLPPHAETLSAIDSDPELRSTNVSVLSKLAHRSERSATDYRRMLAEQLFTTMFNARLSQLLVRPDPPFLSAGATSSDFVREADIFRYSAHVKPDGVARAFTALSEELARVERHGFIEPELKRAQATLLRSMQHAVKEREKRPSRSFAQEIVRHFLEAEAMPGAEGELALYERFLPSYTLAELNQLGKTLTSGSRVISITGSKDLVAPLPRALLDEERAIATRELAPYEEKPFDLTSLLRTLGLGGRVVATTTIEELGISEWKLSNGVRVVVRPSDFQNDELRMAAFSPGGHSLVKDADFAAARVAAVVAEQSGVAEFDAVTLSRFFAGKLFSVSTELAELEERVSGRAAPDDLENLLALTYAKLTQPRRDQAAFEAWRARASERSRNRLLMPEAAFEEELSKLLTQNHPRRAPLTPEVLARIELDKALSIYRERFSQAGDYTFLFVGNVELERLKPLVEAYLGALPKAKGPRETFRDTKVFYPRGVKTLKMQRGSEPKSSVALTFHGSAPWSRDAANDLRTLREVLRLRLHEVLREDLGGVYGVDVSGGHARRPRPEYALSIRFGCAPGNEEALKQAVFAELESLAEKGAPDELLQKVKEARRRSQETDLRDNAFWLRELERAYTYGDDPRLILDTAMLDKVTSARVRGIAKRFASSKDYVVGILEPEARAASPVTPPTP